MTPEDGAINAEYIEKSRCLDGGPTVKIKRHIAGDASGMAVARAIWDQNAKLALECRDLAVKRIDRIAPAAMKENKRFAVAKFAVVDGDRAESGGVRRLRQIEMGHLTLPFREKNRESARRQSFRARKHGPYITTENSRTQGIGTWDIYTERAGFSRD